MANGLKNASSKPLLEKDLIPRMMIEVITIVVGERTEDSGDESGWAVD